jgi:hypothetical protein
MILDVIATVLTEAKLRPTRDHKPNRLLILDGISVDGVILAVSVDDGDIVIEDLAGRLHQASCLCRLPLADPQCFETLVINIHKIWKEVAFGVRCVLGK